MGKGFQGQRPPPQVWQEKGRDGLVVKQQFHLGKAVLREITFDKWVSLSDLPSTSTMVDSSL